MVTATAELVQRHATQLSSAWQRARDFGTLERAGKYAAEALAQFRIAGPLVLASLVNMGMSITDVVMMGWLGPTSLAAGAVASDFYSIVFYLCAGVVAASSAMIAQARGAGRHGAVRQIMQQAFWAAALLSLPGMVVVAKAPEFLALIGVAPEIIEAAGQYSAMMAFTLLPMLGVAAWRQILAAFADTGAVLRVTLMTLGLNALGNYVFMFGVANVPAMGLAGAGLSSALCGVFMFVMLSVHALRNPTLKRYRLTAGALRPDWGRLLELFRLGVPIGIASLGELGVYLLSTAVIGIFGAEALAAHAVALRSAGVLYALPVGLSQAATVRVGLADGAGDPASRRRAAQTALGVALIAAILVASLVLLLRHDIATLFVNMNGGAEAVVASASVLLLVLAAMEVFEYSGTVAAGVLRGIRDTRVPMLMSVIAYWAIALPTGLGLGFAAGQEALGLWLGLAAGAVTFSTLLLARIRRLAE